MSTPHTRFRAPWKIFWVALALRLACIVIGRTYRVPITDDHFHFGFEMGRIARSLALGQGYANPFNGTSGPTAWVPPLYPLLLALGFKLFGIYTRGAAFFVLAVNSVFSAAIAPAIYEIAARCFDAHGIARRNSKHAEPVALWSAWLWAAYPAALQYAIHWLWEMSLTACFFTWALVFALRLRDNVASLTRWTVFGLLWGLVALSNTTLLICLPAVTLWIVWPSLRTGTLLRPLVGCTIAAYIVALVMLPWIVRNELTMHAFVPARSNFSVELDESLKVEHDGLPYGTALPTWKRDPEFRRYVAMGEVAYAKQRGKEARARLHAHPARFARWTVDRFFYFWDGTPHAEERHPSQEFLRQLSYSFLSVCGLLGLALALKRRIAGARLFACIFLLLPLPYYLITVQPRFRHPLEPLIAILAVYLFRSTSTSQKGSEA